MIDLSEGTVMKTKGSVIKKSSKALAIAKASDTPQKMLTEVELELMSILWRLGEGSVNDVIRELPEGRDLAYTSVSTILRILEQKSIVAARKEGRGHVYVPALRKSLYEKQSVKNMMEKVFDGRPVAMVNTLVKHLLDSQGLDPRELAEIGALITSAAKLSNGNNEGQS